MIFLYVHCFEAFCPFWPNCRLYLCMFFQVLCACKEIMIKMACPDALARLKETQLRDEAEEIWSIYFQKQDHLCLSKLLTESRNRKLQTFGPQNPSMKQPMVDMASVGLLVQVTTHSQPLAPVDVSRLCRELEIPKKSLIYMYLEELDAETDFTDRIRYVLLQVKTHFTQFVYL